MKYDGKNFTIFETHVFMVLARFVCAIILHLALIDELSAGLEKMKFACNHKRDFTDWKLAYLSGLMQAQILLTVEFVCMAIILQSQAPLGIVYNFVSLAIIAEFDNYIYQSLKHEMLKKLMFEEVRNKIVLIRHTTSKRCPPDEKLLKNQWYSPLF